MNVLMQNMQEPTSGSPNSYSLYELAKRKSWNPSTDLEWAKQNIQTYYPTHKQANPLVGFDEYEGLSEERKITAAWQFHGNELSEILFGEQAALLLAAQLVGHAPTTSSRLFLSSQVFDEARHVEFFMRYLSETVGHIRPPSATLKGIVDEALLSKSWIHKYLACHGLIESLAMAKFQQLRRSSNNLLLSNAMELILKDEARHVGYGVEALHCEISTVGQEQQYSYGCQLIEQANSLGQAQHSAQLMASAMDWDEAALRCHLRRQRILHPELGRQCLRYLCQTMRKVGLWCEDFQRQLERYGFSDEDRQQ